MTRRRDAYKGKIDDFGNRGIMPACHDLYTVLHFIERFARERGLLHETVRMGRTSRDVKTLGELLTIAMDAYKSSIWDAALVYRKLQENSEAAWLLIQADLVGTEELLLDSCAALQRTLDDKAIVSRPSVNRARRILAARERESKRQNDHETGGAA